MKISHGQYNETLMQVPAEYVGDFEKQQIKFHWPNWLLRGKNWLMSL